MDDDDDGDPRYQSGMTKGQVQWTRSTLQFTLSLLRRWNLSALRSGNPSLLMWSNLSLSRRWSFCLLASVNVSV